jgi:hypothetical protein
MMNPEHRHTILSAITEMKELITAQSRTLSEQSELIERLMEGLELATKTTGEMSHKIVELQADHQLVNLIKPVNGWMN